jgi:hypothetical protein
MEKDRTIIELDDSDDQPEQSMEVEPQIPRLP